MSSRSSSASSQPRRVIQGNENYYKLLGLDPNCSSSDIKKAYKLLALVYHPDKNRGSGTSTEQFQYLVDAYDTLINGDSRRAYDEQLRREMIQAQLDEAAKREKARRKEEARRAEERRKAEEERKRKAEEERKKVEKERRKKADEEARLQQEEEEEIRRGEEDVRRIKERLEQSQKDEVRKAQEELRRARRDMEANENMERNAAENIRKAEAARKAANNRTRHRLEDTLREKQTDYLFVRMKDRFVNLTREAMMKWQQQPQRHYWGAADVDQAGSSNGFSTASSYPNGHPNEHPHMEAAAEAEAEAQAEARTTGQPYPSQNSSYLGGNSGHNAHADLKGKAKVTHSTYFTSSTGGQPSSSTHDSTPITPVKFPLRKTANGNASTSQSQPRTSQKIGPFDGYNASEGSNDSTKPERWTRHFAASNGWKAKIDQALRNNQMFDGEAHVQEPPGPNPSPTSSCSSPDSKNEGEAEASSSTSANASGNTSANTSASKSKKNPDFNFGSQSGFHSRSNAHSNSAKPAPHARPTGSQAYIDLTLDEDHDEEYYESEGAKTDSLNMLDPGLRSSHPAHPTNSGTPHIDPYLQAWLNKDKPKQANVNQTNVNQTNGNQTNGDQDTLRHGTGKHRIDIDEQDAENGQDFEGSPKKKFKRQVQIEILDDEEVHSEHKADPFYDLNDIGRVPPFTQTRGNFDFSNIRDELEGGRVSPTPAHTNTNFDTGESSRGKRAKRTQYVDISMDDAMEGTEDEDAEQAGFGYSPTKRHKSFQSVHNPVNEQLPRVSPEQAEQIREMEQAQLQREREAMHMDLNANAGILSVQPPPIPSFEMYQHLGTSREAAMHAFRYDVRDYITRWTTYVSLITNYQQQRLMADLKYNYLISTTSRAFATYRMAMAQDAIVMQRFAEASQRHSMFMNELTIE